MPTPSHNLRGRNPRPVSTRQAWSHSPNVSLPFKRDIMQGLSQTPLQTISKLAANSADKQVEISNLQYAGSYNWTDNASPTIFVPGSPRHWLDKPMPYHVHTDDGIAFVDQNGFRCPSATLLPLLMAVERTAEDDGRSFEWSSVDFVTDRNGLRKLLRWIGGTASRDFRIDMQLAGKHTILLNRWETCTREQMSGRTYGFNFEKASTAPAPGCERSTGHHRIVRYDLNGLQMVVRFEVDACIPSAGTPVPTQAAPSTVDDLIGALSSVNLRTPNIKSLPPSTAESSASSKKITVLSGGSYVPQSSIIEMTTRAEHRESAYEWKDAYPQLFLSQTPHHFLAVHQTGKFVRVNKRALKSTELQSVAASMQHDLKKLRRVLDVIKGLVVKHGGEGRLSLVCQRGVLKVFQRISKDSCLPDDVLEWFTD